MPLDADIVPLPARARELIDAELGRFLGRHAVRRVIVAAATLPPPPLAYLVSFPRLSVTLSGAERVGLEQGGRWRSVRAGVGDAIFVPANVANAPAFSGRARVLTVLFGRRHTGVSLVATGAGPARVLKAQLDPAADDPALAAVPALTAMLAREPDSPACPHLVMALLHGLRPLLGREPRRDPAAAGAKANRTFQSLCLYAQEHFHLPLTRDGVAGHFGLSPSHVSRLFRRQGLMTFGDYLNFVRVDRAKLLLRRHADFSIDEVGLRCGFREASHFCRVFKRRARMTPTQYRLAGAQQ